MQVIQETVLRLNNGQGPEVSESLGKKYMITDEQAIAKTIRETLLTRGAAFHV